MEYTLNEEGQIVPRGVVLDKQEVEFLKAILDQYKADNLLSNTSQRILINIKLKLEQNEQI